MLVFYYFCASILNNCCFKEQKHPLMKRKLLFALMLLLGFSLSALAQNKDPKVEERIQLARTKYTEGKDLIANNAEKDKPSNYTTVVRKQNWPTTGQRVEKTEFYYKEIVNEEDLYATGYALCMVCNTYNVAAREYYEEYVYDNNGQPLFFYARYDEANAGYAAKTELRQYYDAEGNAIRTIYMTSDKNGKMKEIKDSDSEIVQSGKFMLRFVGDNFAHLKAMFDTIYNYNTNK